MVVYGGGGLIEQGNNIERVTRARFSMAYGEDEASVPFTNCKCEQDPESLKRRRDGPNGHEGEEENAGVSKGEEIKQQQQHRPRETR